jgi:hypothetical protein
MNEAQKFLLSNECDDLRLKDAQKVEDWIYISDMMELYHQAQVKKLTTPVYVENKELPVYKVVFNEGTGSGVASINLTKTPLFNAKQTGEHLRSSCDWCNPPQHQ